MTKMKMKEKNISIVQMDEWTEEFVFVKRAGSKTKAISVIGRVATGDQLQRKSCSLANQGMNKRIYRSLRKKNKNPPMDEVFSVFTFLHFYCVMM